MKNIPYVDLEVEGFTGLLRLLRIHGRWIGIACVLGCIAAAVACLVIQTKWRAEGTVVPSTALSGRSSSISLGGLAGSVPGVGMLLGNTGESSSALYPSIVGSRSIRELAVVREFRTKDGDWVSLQRFLAPDEADSSKASEKAIAELAKSVGVRFDRKSGVTTIQATVGDPQVAADLVNFLVGELDKYSRRFQTEDAARQSAFIHNRLQEVEEELARSESDLQEFLASNRAWSDSPILTLERSRLIRDMELNQQLYVTLRSQLEIVTIESQRDLPLIAVLDRAHTPRRAYSPRTARIVASVGILAGFLAFLVAIVLNSLGRPTPGPDGGTRVSA